MTHDPGTRRPISIEIAPRTIVWALAAVAGVWLLTRLWPIIVLVVVALVLVGTLNPLVGALERRGLGRGLALAAVFVSLILAVSLILLLTIPPLASQLVDIVAAAPAQKERLIAWLASRPFTAPLAEAVRDAGSDQLVTAARDHLFAYSSQAFKVIGYGVTALFLAFYFLADGARTQGALFAVVPRAFHLRLARILLNLETIVGGYMRGQLITSAAITVFTFGLLTIFRVDNALSLAMFAGLTDIIPFVGGILATTPAVLGALPRGGGVAIAVLAIMLVYQEFESRILVPRVYGRTLRLSAASVILALLIGGILLGILGALLALPIAAGLQMIVRELRVEMPGDDTDDRSLRVRDQRAEATYERRSAGAAPDQAAVIAGELASEIRAADGDPATAAEVPLTSGRPPADG